MAVMYGPVCIMGYLTYHDSIRDSIIPSIQTVWIQQACNILITIHCILTLTIVFNPLNQEIEDLFGCPHHFCWQRVVIRTGIMIAVVFVAETIPNFGPLLDLFDENISVGVSSAHQRLVAVSHKYTALYQFLRLYLTLTSVILPCLFYLYLNARQVKEREEGKKDDASASIKE
ncbi:hypothetical protein ANCDUO_06188 [Ancylostoma duodenale]|uniref:Amino acid transporter transmembrane domain-containing protein n=1 Tax=Ancylostoma duodenale TaxID=51022 RepID=A0A0C2D2C8_9BILA|nr:hypothetical protein ANCDUO_06188 [Ancylostoma duodenale]